MIEPVNKTEIPAQLSQENKSSYQDNKNSYQATQAGPGMVGFQEWDGKNLEKIKKGSQSEFTQPTIFRSVIMDIVLNFNTYNIDENEESRAGKKEVITSA